MPELPEIAVIAQQMSKTILGKVITHIESKQPKNLNMSVKKFVRTIKGKRVKSVKSKGKWLFISLDKSYFLLINLGMGAELWYFKQNRKLPENYQFRLTFADGTGFTARFWWFGYIHLVPERNLKNHKMTAQLGVSPLDDEFTFDNFKKLLANRKMTLKSFILDQKNVAGIGNVYAQDILFKSKLHPNRSVSTLSTSEVKALYEAIREVLNKSIRLGGAFFDTDFFGNKGGLTMNDFLVGYKTGKPCPKCGAIIRKIRTGSTSSYICPECQKTVSTQKTGNN